RSPRKATESRRWRRSQSRLVGQRRRLQWRLRPPVTPVIFGKIKRPPIHSGAFPFLLCESLRPQRLCVILFFLPDFLASLHPRFLLLAMHRIQRSLQRIQRLIRRLQNFFLISARVLFQPSAPRRAVPLVGFLVHRQVCQFFRRRLP